MESHFGLFRMIAIIIEVRKQLNANMLLQRWEINLIFNALQYYYFWVYSCQYGHCFQKHVENNTSMGTILTYRV